MIFAGLLLGASSPLWAQGSAQPAPTLLARLDDSADGTQYTCPVGQLFEIALAENATTGFVWSKTSTADAVLKLLDETTEYPGVRIGQGGFRHYLFRAAEQGSGTVRLIYSRPWESVPPAKVFTLQVQVTATPSLPQPAISGLSTAALRPGDSVVVKGSDFVPGSSLALLDGRPVLSLFLAPDTGILQVPDDIPAGSHTVTVQTGDQSSAGSPLTVSPAGPDYDPFASSGLRGDMDGDGQLTLKDAVLLLRQILGLA